LLSHNPQQTASLKCCIPSSLCTVPHGINSTNCWASFTHHMALAIRGASYLFSILQHVLANQPLAPRIPLDPLVKASLQDWCTLAMTLATHPMPITSLVPRAPAYIGSVDASRDGLGGCWLASQFGSIPTPTASPSCQISAINWYRPPTLLAASPTATSN
jgi:hypothetical protein